MSNPQDTMKFWDTESVHCICEQQTTGCWSHIRVSCPAVFTLIQIASMKNPITLVRQRWKPAIPAPVLSFGILSG